MVKILTIPLALISSFGFGQNTKLIDSLKYEITIANSIRIWLKR